MNESTLIAIMAHKDIKDTLERHLPFWYRYNYDIRVFSPADNAIHGDAIARGMGVECQVVGSRGHNGQSAMARFIYLLSFLATDEVYGRIILAEYDSLITQLIWPDPDEDEVAAMFFHKGDSNFTAEFYPHPPLFMRRETLLRIVQNGLMAPEAEGGMWDRWFGRAMELSGVKPKNMIDQGFSRNTVHPAHYPDLTKAVAKGAWLFHGIKDAAALDIIVKGTEL